MMQIIPVIDLLNGVVVHAKKGERQHYQPIQSLLTSSSKPLDIVAALLETYPFTQLYIADLNAIQKTAGAYKSNYNVVEAVTKYYPSLTLWVDAGISNIHELSAWGKLNVRLVLGSENFANIDNYCSLKHYEKNFVLSLDFMPHGYQGPTELLTNDAHWPQDVIVMSLANVGASQGANIPLLGEILNRKKDFDIYAAGGIRDVNDLILLKQIGLDGVLIATALHQKQITTKALENLAQQIKPD
jgi:phosphoribosylformimino-5-aminoimidazole carboxamide ribotide isomerase